MLIFGSLEKELYTFPTSNFSIISKVNRVKGIGGEAMVADNQKTIFMALADKPHVHRWNVSQPISQAQTIIEDANLNWINSMWIDQGFLWMTHNK